MSKKSSLERTESYVRETLLGAEAGHDWNHIARVRRLSRQIGEAEGADLFVVEMAALLHDISDHKFNGGDEEAGPRLANELMIRLSVDEDERQHVVHIIRNVSFKGGREEQTFSSLELDVVQDADRLDAMGAVGIARAFHYGGFKNRPLYDPSVPLEQAVSKEAYMASATPTINHFYEKLFLLKDRMNTATGRRLAEARHRFMEDFVRRFMEEWG